MKVRRRMHGLSPSLYVKHRPLDNQPMSMWAESRIGRPDLRRDGATWPSNWAFTPYLGQNVRLPELKLPCMQA